MKDLILPCLALAFACFSLGFQLGQEYSQRRLRK